MHKNLLTTLLIILSFSNPLSTKSINISKTKLDTTPPTIKFTGGNPLEIGIGEAFDPLADVEISDDTDDNVSVEVLGYRFYEHLKFGTYNIKYWLTDNVGNHIIKKRAINIVPKVGVYSSKVKGHTASLKSRAKFSVQLKSQPSTNVKIPLSSSNSNEGVIEGANFLLFKPENWNKPQSVIVKGQNPNVVNGEQNYSIILGQIESEDTNYKGLNPKDVEMRGFRVSLTEFEKSRKFIAGLSMKVCTTTNKIEANYKLIQSPSGMSIDKRGCVEWKAQDEDVGKSFEVEVEAVSDDISSRVTFNANVAMTQVLETKVIDNRVIVIDETTNLKDMEMILPSSEVANQIKIRKILEDDVPVKVADNVINLSDIFIIENLPSYKNITLKLSPFKNPQPTLNSFFSFFQYELTREGIEYWNSRGKIKNIIPSLNGDIITIDLFTTDNLSVFFSGMTLRSQVEM